MKLYLVVVERYFDGYGTNVACLGAFDTREKAEKLEKHYVDTIREFSDKKFTCFKNIDKRDLYEPDLKRYKFENIISMADANDFFKIIEIDLNVEYPLFVKNEYIRWSDGLDGGIELANYAE